MTNDIQIENRYLKLYYYFSILLFYYIFHQINAGLVNLRL